MYSARFLKLFPMVLLIFIAACGSNPSATSTSPRLVTVPTSSWRPGDPALEALVTGSLQSEYKGNQYCVWLSFRSSRISIIWPKGYHVRLNPLELLNSHSAVVAKGGERIRSGGGFAPAKPSGQCMLGHKEAFYVMSGISVIASPR